MEIYWLYYAFFPVKSHLQGTIKYTLFDGHAIACFTIAKIPCFSLIMHASNISSHVKIRKA